MQPFPFDIDTAGVDLSDRPRATRTTKPDVVTAPAPAPVEAQAFENKIASQQHSASTPRTPPGRQLLYVDIETAPDESRLHLFGLHPLPEMLPVTTADSLMPADQFITQTIDVIKAWFSTHNPPTEWVEECTDAERRTQKTGNARKGWIEAVDVWSSKAKSIADAAEARCKLLSVTPEYCRIVALGFALGGNEAQSSVAIDPGEEHHLLRAFWTLAASQGPIVGFNVSAFDLAVLRVRSAILGIRPTINLYENKPWDTGKVIDLMKLRFPSGPAMGLKKLAACYGISVPAGDCDGSKVAEMVQAGQAEEIGRYVRSDIEITRDLHRIWTGYFAP